MCADELHDSIVNMIIRRQGSSLGKQLFIFFLGHKKQQQTHKKNKPKLQNKRKDLQPGSRIIRLDAFLWSSFMCLLLFLSFRCLFGSHPSPSIPLFCLCHINTIREWPADHTGIHLSFFWFVLHTYTCTQTHKYKKALLTKCGGLVRGPPLNTHKHFTCSCREHSMGFYVGKEVLFM